MRLLGCGACTTASGVVCSVQRISAMPHRRRTGNEVLDRMPAERRADLVRRAELCHLEKEHILAEPRHPSSKVFFPTTAVISVVLPLQMGQRVEAGTVGCEG